VFVLIVVALPWAEFNLASFSTNRDSGIITVFQKMNIFFQISNIVFQLNIHFNQLCSTGGDVIYTSII